jgi:hypothetical protein
MMRCQRVTISSSAWSQVIAVNWPLPFGPVRRRRQAFRRIDQVHVAVNLPAREARGEWLVRIALDLDDAPILDLREQR